MVISLHQTSGAITTLLGASRRLGRNWDRVISVPEPNTSKDCSLCGDAHEGGRVKRGLYKCPRIGMVINADLNGARNISYIPESLGSMDGGLSVVRDRGNGLKAQPVGYRWTNGAGWVNPTSYEVVRMKAVNHEPMNRPRGTSTL
ncbi:MAG: zinc ribbon domain-containing protein [Thermocladium sp.]